MKKNVMWRAVVVATLAMIAACDLIPLDDGGGGGVVGGDGLTSFRRGVVFIRADDREVYIADESDLSDIARLTRSGGNKHPSLSNDGRQVVFVHGSGANAVIQTVPVAGGAPSTVLSADSMKAGFSRPVFSPDDATIAFTFERGGASYVGIRERGRLELRGFWQRRAVALLGDVLSGRTEPPGRLDHPSGHPAGEAEPLHRRDGRDPRHTRERGVGDLQPRGALAFRGPTPPSTERSAVV